VQPITKPVLHFWCGRAALPADKFNAFSGLVSRGTVLHRVIFRIWATTYIEFGGQACEISSKSDYPRSSYCDLIISNLVAVRHLTFGRK